MKKILIAFFILIGILFSNYSISYAKIDFNDAKKATESIESSSISAKSGTSTYQVKDLTLNVFKTLKIVVGALLVFYLVYAGVMMAFSMGDDEEKLKESKRSLWYALIGLIFINIPGSIYSMFEGKKTTDVVTGSAGGSTTIYTRNIYINTEALGTVLGSIVIFLQIALAGLATIIIVYSGIRIMLANGKEDTVNSYKGKIFNSLLGLIFLGILEGWKTVVYKGDLLNGGQEIFAKLANLALFFAGPIAIFFLTLAGYYYITAAGNDDKIKKAKNIVINTALATLILIGMYTFFGDLQTLF